MVNVLLYEKSNSYIPNVIYFRKLTKTTTEDDLNGFVGLVKELIPVNGKLLKY